MTRLSKRAVEAAEVRATDYIIWDEDLPSFGVRTATRTIGLLSGILTYAVNLGIIEKNPAHGIKRPKDYVRRRRLSEAEYRLLGRLLRDAEAKDDPPLLTTAHIIRQIALTDAAVVRSSP